MKDELRIKYKKIRDEIEDKEIKDKIIFEKVIKNSKVLEAKTILIYVSKDSEVDTFNLIEYFLKYKNVAVPKTHNNEIEFYYIKSLDELELGSFNVLEPTPNNLVTDFTDSVSITPGIAFSKDNYRIGYGKGYYDRFYSKNKVFSIGLCYKECLTNNIYPNEYDQKLDEVITD